MDIINFQHKKKMEIRKNFSALVMLFTALTMSHHCCLGQNSPKDYLDVHNAARSEVGVGPMTWAADLADYAQNFVDQRIGDCNLVHSKASPYGENLAKGTGDFSGRAAAELWVGEKRDYNYNTNSCLRGECLHYTQVVWKSSVRLGCARARCSDGWWFVSCNYDPPGNFVGIRPFGADSFLRTRCYYGDTNLIM